MVSRSPLSPGPGIEIDRAVRLADEGHVLLGGCPPRAVRLSPEQVSTLIRWLSGSVPGGADEGLLARGLVRAGLAHPRPLSPGPADTVDVAVVGQAGPTALGATLDHLARHHPNLRPVVVGATGPDARAARDRGARVVPGPAGGAGARAAALRLCSADLVALVEAGTRPAAGWLDTALGHFRDPLVAAVVPRVLADRSHCLGHMRMTVAAVAESRAGADRGADPAPVLPWGHGTPEQGRPGPANEHTDPLRPVPALVLRRAASDLDPGLGAAAELDLLWRLAGGGWSVRYEPRSRMWAPPTTGLGGYLRACFTSGAVAGPLARRHGRRAVGPELSLAGAVGLALAASGRPGAALLAGALGGASVVGELRAGARTPLPEAVRLAGLDLAHTVRTGAHAARTAWWPLAAAAAVGGAAVRSRGTRSGRSGRSPVRAGRIAAVAGAALVLPHVASWHRGRGAALTGPVTWTVLGMAGDAARSLGAWWGVAGSGSPAPLVPRIRPTAVAGPVPVVRGRDRPARAWGRPTGEARPQGVVSAS
ncbi:family 2 glycosyl transferase [Nocardiopsis sp. TSRI0078]|uniref:family 2 glycosyl transferase n=1 Tax=unclassified Nocardiopsis TaxID=2649073 RepID=UPI00093DD673|nr:family 2 glycosyl transferase [Nocardiopsis sp. TSRI0078]OKI19029.1 family 2 glycosyl transferase [Nocardiopsis sp. TSRI0078]